MRRIVPAVLLTLVAIISADLAAQSPPPPRRPNPNAVKAPVKDPNAVTVVQAAITAMGGAPLIGQIQSWQLQGQLQHTGKNGSEADSFVWEAAGTDFRMQTVAPSATTVVVTGHGTPVITSSGVGKPMPAHVIRAMFIPALVGSVLLKELQDPNCSMKSAGAATLGAESVSVVRTAGKATWVDTLVTPQTWYFDAASGLPVRVEYLLPVMAGPRLQVQSAADFSNYQNVGGALYPFRIVRSHFTKQSDVFILQSVNVNLAISPSDFDAPVGGAQ